MANRYWVGGTATWDNLALLKWSTTSGGLGGSAVPTSADTVFFDANSGANTVTIGAGTAICSTLTMTGFTGTLAFGSNSIDLAGTGTITVYTGATTFSVTGTPLMLVTGNTASTRTINPTATTEANSISFNISAGSGAITTQATTNFRSLTFSGTYTGTLNTNTRTLYGNLTLKSGMVVGTGGTATTFAATSGTQTITSAGLNLDFPTIINATGATVQLVDDLSVGTATARNFTLTSGTLDLNDKTLTIFGAFVSSNTNTRSVLFGTIGNITLTNTAATIFSIATATNFSITGTPTINVTANATTGTRRLDYGNTAAPASPEANSLSVYVTDGSDAIQLTSTFPTRNLFFGGTFTGSLVNSSRNIYGDLTFKSGMTLAAGANTTTFAATSGTQFLTSAALTLDFPVTINGVGTTVQLVDALIMGSARNLGLTNGTFNSNAKNVTCGTFGYSNGNTKELTLANSTVTILGGTSSSGFNGSNTGTTFNITGTTVIFTTSGTALFNAGGNTTFPAVTMGGTGQLIIGQATTSPTITTLSNTVQPCTISLLSTIARLNVTNFNLSGTAGNLVTFNSTVAGTQANIRKTSGTVNAYYLNIQDSLADGGAVWYANSSINGTNNTGWNVFNNSFLMVF